MSEIEKLDPRIKLIWSSGIIIMALISQNILMQLTMLLELFALDIILGGSKGKYKVLVPVMGIIACQILLIQILFQRNGEVIFEYGILTVYSGFLHPFVLGILRTMAITIAAVQFVASTTAKQVYLMFLSWNIPYRYAMLPMMARRFFPLINKEFKGIKDSQAIRGIPQDGIINKGKNLLMAVMPLLYRVVRHVSDIALSMELRGYGRWKVRTTENQLMFKKRELAGLLFMMVGLLTTHVLIK